MQTRNFFEKTFCFIFLISSFSSASFSQTPYTPRQDTDFPTYEELKSLSANPHPEGKLESKLHRFFRRPIISNEAFYLGAKPHLPVAPRIGKFLRVATWNIEKSMEMPRVIEMLSNPAKIKEMIDEPVKPASKEQLVEEIQRVLPEFHHIASAKTLDQRL